MKIVWSVDDDAIATVWADISRLYGTLLRLPPGTRVLDLGGGNADFATSLTQGANQVRIVTLDAETDALHRALPGTSPLRGDVLALPFQSESFDAVTARAILHHVPQHLDAAFREAVRVLRPGGRMVVQEPCANNVVANMARRLFPTERHEEGEEPLDPEALVGAMRGAFELLEEHRHFVFSYIMPHVVRRVPRPTRRLALGMASALTRLDKDLLSDSPFMLRRCAYITLVGEKAQPVRSTTDK